jgi:hypothetical protein
LPGPEVNVQSTSGFGSSGSTAVPSAIVGASDDLNAIHADQGDVWSAVSSYRARASYSVSASRASVSKSSVIELVEMYGDAPNGSSDTCSRISISWRFGSSA